MSTIRPLSGIVSNEASSTNTGGRNLAEKFTLTDGGIKCDTFGIITESQKMFNF